MSIRKIVILGGDGIGPEVTKEAVKILETVGACRPDLRFELSHHLLGGCAIDQADGDPYPRATSEACRAADAILLGAVGGPKWTPPAWKGSQRPEQGLLRLRKELDLYANLRPCGFASPSLLKRSPLKEERARGVDFVVVRELVGGAYFGHREEADYSLGDKATATDTMPYSVWEVKRITRLAAYLSLQSDPPRPITSIDKANVLASSRLWRKVVTETIAEEFPQLVPLLFHELVDSTAMIMVSNPRKLNGVILTENLFGDILSDESSVIPGSLGLLPSASLSSTPLLPDAPDLARQKCLGMYEPIHGSAPDIAGQGIANPIGTILSVALMFKYSFGWVREGEAIELAVKRVLDEVADGGQGLATRDLGGTCSTGEMGDAVATELQRILKVIDGA